MNKSTDTSSDPSEILTLRESARWLAQMVATDIATPDNPQIIRGR